jgi:hypothetical protein
VALGSGIESDVWLTADRLWLTYWHLPVLAAWRRRWPQVRLVYPTLFLGSAHRSTALLDRLAAIDVDAVNVLHHGRDLRG